MGLSPDLISEFVKVTNDSKKSNIESSVFGTIVEYNNANYVRLDGSELLTPISTTTDVHDGERVMVTIKNHTAIITGNMSSPSVNLQTPLRNGDDTTTKIGDLGIIVADKVNTKEFNAEKAKIDDLYVDILNVEKVEVDGELIAKSATIDKLQTDKLDATWANIDFANIDKAVMDEFYATSGLIEKVTISEGVVVKQLVGVTIKGDLIEGGTVAADKLVVLGEDGIYYKLNINGETIETEQTEYNSLNGSILTAKSITAEKVSVEDLVAFGATIGGFNITNHSLHSGVKESVDNTTVGMYMDTDAQFAIGDENNYLKFYKDDNDNYRLDISAASVLLSHSSKDIESSFSDVEKQISDASDTLSGEIEKQKSDYEGFIAKFSKYIRFMEDENGNPTDTAMTIGSGDSTITLEIDNEKGLIFKKNGVPFGSWDGVDFYTGNIIVEVNERAQFGNFAEVPRSDGSLSLLKVR